MPLIGIKCPRHGEVKFEDALNHKKCDCYPRFFLDTIIATSRKDYHKGNIITATTLLGCLRETYLLRKYPYYAPIQSLYYSWRGTLIHSIFERPHLPGWVSEQTFSKTITLKNNEKIAITGKLDGYDNLTQTLWDLKTIGDKGLIYVVRDGAKEEHKPQVNIYRWLSPYTVKRLRIMYLTMMSFAETGKLNEIVQSLKRAPNKSKQGFEYFIEPTDYNAGGYGNYRVFYNTPEIEIWSDEQVMDFILPRAEIMYNSFTNNLMPPKCAPDMQTWKCDKYCHAKDFCKAYEELVEKENSNADRGSEELHRKQD